MEFIQYYKITAKMLWLLFAKTLESLCDTENCELFAELKTLYITVYNDVIIPSY